MNFILKKLNHHSNKSDQQKIMVGKILPLFLFYFILGIRKTN
jgi:hypothetical protein